MINSSTCVCSPLFENGVGWGNDTVIQTINPTGLFHFISSFNKITNNNNDININKHMQRRRRVNNSNNNNNFFFFQKASVALITKLPNLPSICFPFLSISYHIISYHHTLRLLLLNDVPVLHPPCDKNPSRAACRPVVANTYLLDHMRSKVSLYP